MGSSGSIVTALIWANAAIFIFQMLSQMSTAPGRADPFTALLWLSGPHMRQLEVWRLGTYMFAHGGFFHILINMWGLFLFGRPLERRIGSHNFLRLYFVSGLIGGVTWLLFNWTSPIPVIGASGAVFGVMMAAAMMFPNEMIILLFPPIPMKLKTFVLVFGGIEILMSLQRGSTIAHIAHLGGFLGAFLFMRRYRTPWSPTDWIRSLYSKYRRKRANDKQHRFQRTSSQDDRDSNPADDIDRILDKIGSQGLDSLTPEERRTLQQARERLRNQRRHR